jgi:hypothetical protein
MQIVETWAPVIAVQGTRLLVVAASLGLAGTGCAFESHGAQTTSTSSAITTIYQGESMAPSGTGEVRNTPAPTHWLFWGNGHLTQSHNFAGGGVTITVRAQGVLAAGVGPHIVVSVGGVVIGDAHVNETTWTTKTFTASVAAGTKEVRVAYDNDLHAPPEDRGLLVDWVSVSDCASSTGLVISVPLSLDRPIVQAGQSLTGAVTYSNCSNAAISILEMRIAGRRPGATHTSGPFDDFTPFQGATSLAARSSLTLTSSRSFTAADPAGSWISYATYKDAVGVWHDGPEVSFTVQPAEDHRVGGTPYPSGVAFRGINRAGMEYGELWNGWTGQTFFEQPSHSQITSELAYFKAKGMNVIRLPISWERIQHQLYGGLTQTYVDRMMDYINSATTAGFAVILDLHNYNRYATNTHDAQGQQVDSYTQRTLYDGVLTVDHLRDVWVKLTGLVIDNPNVILNLMNESHDFQRTSNGWFADINTLIAAIRATGSTHLILVPNSRSSDVDHWSTYSPNGGDLDSVAALAVTDSADHYAYDMHAYQTTPASCTSYRDLIVNVTNWATSNGKKMFLSELGVGVNAANGSCAIHALLSYMNAHADVWIGWTPWDLQPYNLTVGRTADGAEMPWYAPFLTANFLP